MTRRLLFPLWLLAVLAGLGGACRDPNPTFVFDAGTDGAREGGTSDGGGDGGLTDGGGQ